MTPRILIVDDSLTVRMDLKETFEAAGFDVTACETSGAAREALTQQAFSLVVLDVLLPDGDGVELLRDMKAAPATAAVPVMLLSTEAEVRDRVRGMNTGADDYVGKPYDAAYVLARARTLLGQSAGQTPSSGPRLLLIDDSATFREALAADLEFAGYEVTTAQTGEDGLRLAPHLRPSAIIVDDVLPGGMHGAAVIRRLKEDVSLRNTPCLLLTASEEDGGEVRAYEAGADVYLRKEAGTEVILARILAALRPASTPPLLNGSSSLLGPKRILAVDDSPTYLHSVAAELRREGYEVILALSGKEALDLLEVQPVDAILLDLLMPGLSGQETCRRIKGSAHWRNVPLLMLTAVEESEAMIEGINAGADDYIPKSADFEVLRARLRAQLRRKQYEDENRRIREELMQKEFEAAKADAARAIAEARAVMTEELERKNRDLEAFGYSVAHDLRAPLRSIDGFSQALLEDCADQLSPEGREYLSLVLAAAKRMSDLIDDLLALSQVGQTRLDRVPTDLTRLARAVAADLEAREPDRQVDFIAEEGLEADADPRLMRVALENVLGNAWKFTRKKDRARIEFGATRGSNGPEYFVRDNGVGFDMAFSGKLFRPFERLHGDSEFAGTGVGLATVHRIIDRHGGRVRAEAYVGGGATIFFTLPAKS